MSTTTTKPTLAFFGATGGCASATLASALKDGYTATALARTPSKLTNLLSTTHSLSTSTLNNLIIHSGNVKSVTDVKRALISPANPSHLVSTIIFGVGGSPQMQASITKPCTLDDPHVCEMGMSTVLTALRALSDEDGITTTAAGTKPVIVTISTTGIGAGKRDVPLALYPLYHWMLQIPHADKKKMEELLFTAARDQRIADFVIVRPTLLTDGAPKGTAKVRAGWEWGMQGMEGRQAQKGPELGWTIGRTDVGAWIFEEVIRNGGWEGKCVSLTY